MERVFRFRQIICDEKTKQAVQHALWTIGDVFQFEERKLLIYRPHQIYVAYQPLRNIGVQVNEGVYAPVFVEKSEDDPLRHDEFRRPVSREVLDARLHASRGNANTYLSSAGLDIWLLDKAGAKDIPEEYREDFKTRLHDLLVRCFT
jgi:hypothetical protein